MAHPVVHFEVSGKDLDSLQKFYSELFGWQAEDMPVGDGASYSLQRLRGKDVAAIAPQPPQQRDAGVPPVWNSYVSVGNADEFAERAAELGGACEAGPTPHGGRVAAVLPLGVRA
jgi:predicted enzyme related to lactoylglutathione lyase